MISSLELDNELVLSDREKLQLVLEKLLLLFESLLGFGCPVIMVFRQVVTKIDCKGSSVVVGMVDRIIFVVTPIGR